jgi:hypothetical protein
MEFQTYNTAANVLSEGAHTAVEAFRRAANDALAANLIGGVVRCAAPLLHLAIGTPYIREKLEHELLGIKNLPNYETPHWETDSLLLETGPRWQLRVSRYTRQADFIYTNPFDMLVVVLDGGSLVCDIYEMPSAFDQEAFKPDVLLGQPRRSETKAGSMLAMEGRRFLFDVQLIEPVFVLKFITATYDPLQWAFSRSTRRSVQAISASPIDSELVSMARAFAAMRRQPGIEALTNLSTHPTHFVRWAAIQALGQVHPKGAIEYIKRAAREDEHSHVRNAAQSTLRTLGMEW